MQLQHGLEFEASQLSNKSLIGAKIAVVIVGFWWILFCLLLKNLGAQTTILLFGPISN
jgi:hypothetical protein